MYFEGVVFCWNHVCWPRKSGATVVPLLCRLRGTFRPLCSMQLRRPSASVLWVQTLAIQVCILQPSNTSSSSWKTNQELFPPHKLIFLLATITRLPRLYSILCVVIIMLCYKYTELSYCVKVVLVGCHGKESVTLFLYKRFCKKQVKKKIVCMRLEPQDIPLLE